jgi:hypothetical protein
MPVHQFPDIRLPRPDLRADLRVMPGTEVPVIRQPFEPGDMLPLWAPQSLDGSYLFDVEADPSEDENKVGGKEEAQFVDALSGELRHIEVPGELLERLGVA